MSNVSLVDKDKQSNISEKLPENIDEWFENKFNECFERREANKTPSMSIVVTKGTLDWAYPPFILASSAAALGWDVSLFFIFYFLRLKLIKKRP